MFGNLGKMMKAASEMKARLPEIQAKIEASEHVGQSGGSVVTVTVNGKGTLKSVKIKPGVLQGDDDREMFEDLILAATQAAQQKAADAAADMMQQFAEDLGLPPGYQDMLG